MQADPPNGSSPVADRDGQDDAGAGTNQTAPPTNFEHSAARSHAGRDGCFRLNAAAVCRRFFVTSVLQDRAPPDERFHRLVPADRVTASATLQSCGPGAPGDCFAMKVVVRSRPARRSAKATPYREKMAASSRPASQPIRSLPPQPSSHIVARACRPAFRPERNYARLSAETGYQDKQFRLTRPDAISGNTCKFTSTRPLNATHNPMVAGRV